MIVGKIISLSNEDKPLSFTEHLYMNRYICFYAIQLYVYTIVKRTDSWIVEWNITYRYRYVYWFYRYGITTWSLCAKTVWDVCLENHQCRFYIVVTWTHSFESAFYELFRNTHRRSRVSMKNEGHGTKQYF